MGPSSLDSDARICFGLLSLVFISGPVTVVRYMPASGLTMQAEAVPEISLTQGLEKDGRRHLTGGEGHRTSKADGA